MGGEGNVELLVFGGTSEGRSLVEWLASRGTCDVVVCAATEYGADLVPAGPRVTSFGHRMPEAQIQDLMREGRFACVVDATHPFATSITRSVAEAAAATGTPLIRLVREGEQPGPWLGAADAAEAADLVAGLPGTVLLTTGSKDLPTFADRIPDFADRVYARILPVPAALEQTVRLGVPAGHVIAMQGPFSQELNRALINQIGARVLVTKASGRAGGFEEKVAAAHECGCTTVVIQRPTHEDGLSFGEVQRALVERYGV